MSLLGRLALVTGGGSGIGRVLCHALANEGAAVVVADVDAPSADRTRDELQGLGKGDQVHRSSCVNVARSDSVAALFKWIEETFPMPVSVVVNCAGILRRLPLVDTPEEIFDELIAINTKGTFLVCQAAVRHMRAKGVREGAIVNVASNLGKAGSAEFGAYATSKAAVIGLTKSLALELAASGIRCNAVLPAYTETPLIVGTDEDKARWAASIPLGRAGQPHEIAAVILFLCTSASSFMTGSAIDVTGGADI